MMVFAKGRGRLVHHFVVSYNPHSHMENTIIQSEYILALFNLTPISKY